MSSVAVVVVAYGAREDLLRCLESTEGAGEVVVVDNAQEVDLPPAVEAARPGSEVLRMEENVGFAAACNAGATATQSDHVMFLNPDAMLAAGAIERLAAFLDEHPDVACVGPRLLHPDGSLQTSAYRFPTVFTEAVRLTGLGRLVPRRLLRKTPGIRSVAPSSGHFDPHDEARPADFITGACMLVRRSAFDAIEGFDETYFLYYEEIDLCRRLAAAGQATWLCPDAGATHRIGASSDTARRLVWEARHRSRIRYFDRHGGDVAAASIRLLTGTRVALGVLFDPLRIVVGRPRAGWDRRARVLRDCVIGAGERQRPS